MEIRAFPIFDELGKVTMVTQHVRRIDMEKPTDESIPLNEETR
jgi:hypothetical protein